MNKSQCSRRDFMRKIAVGVSLAGNSSVALGAVQQRAPSEPPNILLAISDNQSWCHCGFMGDDVVHTPAADLIAQRGMTFNHSYVPCPSCTPSRSAILTGQDIYRLEEAGLLWGGFPAKLPIYTDLLQQAGYHIGYTGKGWGPGNWSQHGRHSDPVGTAYNRIRHGDSPQNCSRTDYAANFQTFLEDRNPRQPFCFWFGAQEPHRPYHNGHGKNSGKRLEDVALPAFLPHNDVVRGDFLDYYMEIEWFDKHLMHMLELLEESGELDNTIVIVTSDNGIQMPRGIATLYDYGVRVPMAISWGDRINQGSQTDAFVNLTDLAPTFLEVAGIPVPKQMTGRSLMSLLTTGNDDNVRDCVVTAIERHADCRPNKAGYPSRAIRTHDYLYIRNYEPERWPAGNPDYEAVAQGYYGDVDRSPTKTWMLEHASNPDVRQKIDLCFGKRPAEELYFIPTDPDQIHNVINTPQHKEKGIALAKRLEIILKETADPRVSGQSPWDTYPYNSIEKLLR